MSRDNSTWKETCNRALTLVDDMGVGAALPTEAELSETWGTSRTTVRAVLAHLDGTGIIAWSGRSKTVLRAPKKADFFSSDETTSTAERVETKFMEHLLGGDLKPGAILREAELTRDFGVSTSVVREVLIRFSRFGLIGKEPNRHWVLRGFTRDFAQELFDVREMFERRAFGAFLDAGPGDPAHAALLSLRDDHARIAADIDAAYLEFPRLDERMHRVWVDRMGNRFVGDFFELVSVIFHYHYRWNKVDERDRNLTAAHEHLVILDAVAAGDRGAAEAAFEAHLATARQTLMRSVTWEGEA